MGKKGIIITIVILIIAAIPIIFLLSGNEEEHAMNNVNDSVPGDYIAETITDTQPTAEPTTPPPSPTPTPAPTSEVLPATIHPIPYTETEPRPANIDQYIAQSYLRTRHNRPALPNFVNSFGADGNLFFSDITALGNGHMGATLFGGVVREYILINEKTLWSGGPGVRPDYPYMNFRNSPHTTQLALQFIRQRLDEYSYAYATQGMVFCDGTNCYPAGFPAHARTDVSGCTGGVHVLSDFPDGLHAENFSGGGANTGRHQVLNDIHTFLTGERTAFGSFQEMGRIVLIDPEAPRPAAPRPVARNVRPNRDNAAGGEGAANIFVENDAKWFAQGTATAADPVWVEWNFDNPFEFSIVTIATANDQPSRDPAAWVLKGRNSPSGEWTIIHNQEEMILPTARHAAVTIDLLQPANFQYFRFEATETRGGEGLGGFQISQLLLGGNNDENDHNSPAEDEAFTSYDRGLLLETGIARIQHIRSSGPNAGVEFTREYFTSFPDNIFAMRVTGSGSFSKTIAIETPQPNAEVTAPHANILELIGQPPGHINDPRHALHFLMQLQVIPFVNGQVDMSRVTAAGGMLEVTDVDEIVILMVAGTNYVQSMDHYFDFFRHREEAFYDIRSRMNAAAAMGYNALLRRHLEDYMRLFGRVDFRLDNAPATAPEETTEQIVWGYNWAVGNSRPGGTARPAGHVNAGLTEARRAELDRYLEILMFQFGRYLLIASSREGSLPANLQGVWAAGLNPPWEADYHTNINIQMNYWPAEVTNLAETHIPKLEYVRSLVPRGEAVARHYHMRPANRPFPEGAHSSYRGGPFEPISGEPYVGQGSRGWVAYHVNNIWAHALPESWYSAFYAPSGGAWMALHIWEHYLFNLDEDMLRKYWPALFGAAIFWEDNLWIDSFDGALVTNPSFSPEHGPYSLGCTSDQALVWEVFDAAIRAAEILGYDTDPRFAADIAAMRGSQANLSGPKIGRAGFFQEWRHETQMDRLGLNTRNPGSGPHRHINHLFPLHPGTMIIPGRSPQDDIYAEAMRVSLGGGRTDGTTGWSRAWTLNIRARLLEDDAAFRVYQGLLFHQKLPSLFGTHAPFQIDGNFGATAGVAEMFIQSHGGIIRLLPAIPRETAWASGRMVGLRARGDITVDQFWSDGGLDSAMLHIGTRGSGEIAVYYSGLANASLYKVQDSDGNQLRESIVFEVASENLISFTAAADASYEIVFAG
ncbi:MAG: glycoside hydrolase family 95 protein [Defluviitaleaceae bacterium]|nr:glycoside hydrolase family 95 protein [Defluviitaleaceae bacterium]